MSVFAYISHRGDYWGGICAAKIEPKELGRWMSAQVRKGYDIMPVATREEYLATIGRMKPEFERPKAGAAQ